MHLIHEMGNSKNKDRGVVAGGRGQMGPWFPPLFQNRRIFGKLNVSLENFWTFGVGKKRF